MASAAVMFNSPAHADQIWEQRYDGPGHGVDRATALAVDSAGNAVVTGYSDNATDDPNNYQID